MIFKFAKAEVFNPETQGHLLTLSVEVNGTKHGLKTSRKIRNRVANFFGESLEVHDPIGPVFVHVHEVGASNGSKQIAVIKFRHEDVPEKQKQEGNLVYQNEHLKLFWGYFRELWTSRKYSADSRDIMNIETPKKQEQPEWRQWKQLMRVYSPDNKKINHIRLFNDEAVSQNGDPSYKTKLHFKKQSKNLCKAVVQKSIIKSKSAATRSKTPSKVEVLMKNSLPAQQIKAPTKTKQTKKELANSFREQNCRWRLNRGNSSALQQKRKGTNNMGQKMTKLGAVVASTIGIFAGLAAGFVAST